MVGAAKDAAVLLPTAAKGEDPTVLDYLLAVDDVRGWHAANAAANGGHCAVFFRLAGPSAIAAVQEWRLGERFF